MFIYVVKPGDTLAAIAEKYGFTVEVLIENNGITDPDNLVVGQTIVMIYPEIIHIVAPEEDLETIARRYDVSTRDIVKNNPSILKNNGIQIGQSLVISYQQPKLGTFSVYGYVYPFVDKDILRRTLPYLTYLSVFSYGFDNEGNLKDLDDSEVLSLALSYEVAPLLVLTPLDEEGNFSPEIASALFYNKSAQDILINNLISVMYTKRYYGVDIDFEYIEPKDRQGYVDFMRNLTRQLNAEGFEVFVDLAPKISEDQKGILYEAHDYPQLGEIANYVLLMTYDWGYAYSEPMAVAPINRVQQVLDYAVTAINPEKIYMGIPNYGYDWPLPYVKGQTRAKSVGNQEAVEIAAEYNATIFYDKAAATPHFTYRDGENKLHEVWFEDARSINEKIRMANNYHFGGIGYWNLMRFFQQNWTVVNALFYITKLYY